MENIPKLEDKAEQIKFNNLITDCDNTIAKLIEMEGDKYMRDQETFNEHSIKNALKKFSEHQEELKMWKEKDPKEYEYMIKSKTPVATIYGMGGWHRYFLLSDGTLAYSNYHGERDTQKAERNGFNIFM